MSLAAAHDPPFLAAMRAAPPLKSPDFWKAD